MFSEDLPLPVVSTGEGVPYKIPGAFSKPPPKAPRKRAAAAAAVVSESTEAPTKGEESDTTQQKKTRKPRTLKPVVSSINNDEEETYSSQQVPSLRPRMTKTRVPVQDDLGKPLIPVDQTLTTTNFDLPLPRVSSRPTKEKVAAVQEEPHFPLESVPKVAPTSSPKKIKMSLGGGKILSFDEWTASLSTPSPMVAADPVSFQMEWLGGFQRYIYMILSAVYTNDTVRAMAVESDMLRIWRRAFTDRSFAADNYETLETIGDKALSVAFAKYVYAKKPEVTPRELSNFIMYYMSNRFQPIISTDLKMETWILFGKEVAKERTSATTKSIKEDIFEAFCGALEAVATLVHSKLVDRGEYETAALHAPSGGDAMRRFVETLFNHYGLNDKFSRNAAKTTIGEIGTIFGMRNRNIYFSQSPSGFSVIIPEDLAVVLEATEGVVGPLSRVVVAGYPSEEEAANAALEVLEAAGIDDRWIATRREEKGLEFIFPSVRDTLVALTKAVYPKLVFEIPISSKSADGSFTMVLSGVTREDQRNVLASGRGISVPELKTRLANEVIQKMS
jgi:dsRNA-specific ribonuclease